MMKLVRSIFDYIVSRLVIVATVFALAVVVDLIAPLKQLDAYFKEYPRYAITLGMLVVALRLVPRGCIFGLANRRERARAKARTSHKWVFRQALAEKRMKRPSANQSAFHSDWLLDSWRPICFGVVGTLLALIGMFGYLFVIGPPTVKVIVGGALAYALVRTAWGFWKA
jgi:hypothetical protein